MAFDGITVAAVVQELEHTLVGGRISKIGGKMNRKSLLHCFYFCANLYINVDLYAS